MRVKKAITLFLLFTILNQIISPTVAYALTAGPTAPEATSFEPVDTTDMVNPLTGDFTYNLPLLEVPGPEGGYPLSLSYHAGIKPNEEASWVGSGWTLNPGAITRNVNGYPDDWSAATGAGGTTSNYWSGGTRSTYSIGVSIGIGGAASVNAGLSFSQDTYKGFGIGESIGYGLGIGNFGIGVQIGVNPYGSTYGGTNVGYTIFGGTDGLKGTIGIGVQTNFQSVNASFNAGISVSGGNSLLGASIGTSNLKPSLSIGGGKVTTVSDVNSGKISTYTSGWSLPIPVTLELSIDLGYQHVRYWSNTSTNFTANGVLNNRSSINATSDLTNGDDDNYSLLDPVNSNIIDHPDPLEVMGGTFPNFDDYNVNAQGLGGNMRPYTFASVLFNQNRVNNINDDSNIYGENLPTNPTPNPIGKKWQFRFINDLSNSYTQGYPDGQPNAGDQSYDFDGNPQYGHNDGTYGYDPATNRLEGTNHIEYFTNDQIINGTAAARGFIDCQGQTGGFTRMAGSQIGGFMITNSSGVTYHYALPVYSSNETTYTQNINTAQSGINSNTISKSTPYAYTWYLTAMTGPDYVPRGTTPGMIDPSDWGYWVKFDYGEWSNNFFWRTPAQGYNIDIDNRFENVSNGTKQVYYLDAIETRTHTAIFEKELRADGKGLATSLANGFQVYQSAVCSNVGTGCVPFYAYPVPTLRLKNILLFQNDQLSIPISHLRTYSECCGGYNGIYGFSASLSNSDGSHNATTVHVFDADNVIDTYDMEYSGLATKCLRKVAFNYDYSLCPGVINSFDPGGSIYSSAPSTNPMQNLGKLTLLSVDFRGKGDTPVIPPIRFQYDLDPADPANQGNISVTQSSANQAGINQPGTIQLQIANKFNVGDIVSFAYGGATYYCTLLSTSDGLNFNVLFLNNSPGATTGSLAAVKTKNPPYNYDAYDTWQNYKSDYVANASNINLSRTTTPTSNMSADVWSLRKISSSIGADININYEGDTYNRSVLNSNKSLIITNGTLNSDNTLDLIIPNPQNEDLTKKYTVGNKFDGVFAFQTTINYWVNNSEGGETLQIIPNAVVSTDSYQPSFIKSISGNDIKISVDPAMLSYVNNPISSDLTQLGTFQSSNVIFLTGNVRNFTTNLSGGGIRVKDLTVDDLNGSVRKTSYSYTMPGLSSSNVVSSGITSYEPGSLDNTQAANLLGVNSKDTKQYQKYLYKDMGYMLSLSRSIPNPGVMYEYIKVSDYSVLPSGASVSIEGSTVYQYEVFKSEMLGIQQYSYYPAYGVNTVSQGNGYHVVSRQTRDMSIKDYTSRIGNLKRVITYDNLGNKLTEKVNHYLNDDLDNTSFQNQVATYEPRLSSYNGVPYNNMGVIKERYGTARIVPDGNAFHSTTNPSSNGYDELVVMSNKETFPTFMTGTTQIDYKNGTQTSQSNLAYDFYTGAVVKTLTIDSYGNRFINQVIPAYMAGNGTVYPALGLKTHDDEAGAIQHKQMLTQQASSYTFSVDGSNNPLGVVSASVQTWGNDVPVLDQDGNSTTAGQSNIWRMKGSFNWTPQGTSTNNVPPYSSFVDYFSTGGSSNSYWKQTSLITQYNVYSAALEASDINNNYAATRMGYSNSKVLITASPSKYNEIAYAGAEDALLSNGNFSNNISPGSGTVISDSTKSHTGIKSLMVASGQNGFTYTVPLSQLDPVRKNYSVAVWVYSPTANVNQASLYYQVGGSSAITPTQTLGKTAAGWYLLEMTVPATAIASGSGNLVVGCQNASSSALYFDDFRMQPTAATATAYVYDNKTGELTYVLGNNNLYTRYQYDAAGRLVRVLKEVLGKTNIPLVKSINYNYGRGN